MYCCIWSLWQDLVLSAASGGISVISFSSIIGVPVGIASATFSLVYSLATWIIDKLLKVTKKKKKKQWNCYVSEKQVK